MYNSFMEKAKWIDEEDEKVKVNLNKKNHLKKLKKDNKETEITAGEYQERIRDYYKKIVSSSEIYKWAEESTESTQTNDLEALLQTNKAITEKKTLNEVNILPIIKMPKITKEGGSHSSIVTSLNFHPIEHNIVLTTGLDKKVKLFHINDSDNKSALNQTLNTLDMPIFSAKFISNEEIIISGRRKHYFIYDIPKAKLERYDGHLATTSYNITSLEKCFVGNNSYAFGDDKGNVFLYDSINKRFKYDIKIQGTVNSLCFDKNGLNVYIVGDQSDIYLFDIRKYRSCINKVSDYGNFYTNYMEISNDNNYLATGSKNGFVNIYSVDDIRLLPNDAEEMKPIKIIDNLTTSCEFLKFNRESSILGMCSKWKKHALKLVNLSTMTVYSNFPSYKDNIKYPFCFDFNSEDKYLSIGNDEGNALLFKINK